jgi:hypothetical protein
MFKKSMSPLNELSVLLLIEMDHGLFFSSQNNFLKGIVGTTMVSLANSPGQRTTCQLQLVKHKTLWSCANEPVCEPLCHRGWDRDRLTLF